MRGGKPYEASARAGSTAVGAVSERNDVSVALNMNNFCRKPIRLRLVS